MADLEELYDGRCGNCGTQTQVKKYPGVWLGPICSTCAPILVSPAQTDSPSKTTETDQAAQTRVPPTLLESEQANASAARRLGYIRRHWRGELSLTVSYWVNFFLFGFTVTVVQLIFLELSPIEHPVHAARFVLLVVLPYLLILYPWQVVGVWRSCRRRIATRTRTFWAHVVQLVVALGCFVTFFQVAGSVVLFSKLYEIAIGIDRFGKYSVSTSDDGTMIHVEGPLGIGVSREVADALRNLSGIKQIVLDSPGGWIYEGRELSKLIMSHGLETYTLTHCYSACTTAFISGNKRYLGTGADLGFHQYRSAIEDLGVLLNPRVEEAKDAQLFRRQGVQATFVSRLFLTPHDDLWYPSTTELRDAGVIHGVARRSDIMPSQYALAAADLADAALANAVFDIIKKHEPRTFARIHRELQQLIEDGATPIEIQGFAADHTSAFAGRYLPQTSDKALIGFAEEIIRFLRLVKSKSPVLCVKLLQPDQYETPNLSKYFRSDDDALQAVMTAMSKVVVDAFAIDNPRPTSDASATADAFDIMSRLGDDAKYLDPANLQTAQDYEKACDVGIRLYELILEQDNAPAVLRFVVSPE